MLDDSVGDQLRHGLKSAPLYILIMSFIEYLFLNVIPWADYLVARTIFII